jgi:hypothetical protein
MNIGQTLRIWYRRGVFKTTDVRHDPVPVPQEVHLEQNYPNPFNSMTVMSYELRVKSGVRLVVYDLLGREVATLISETKEPGKYSVEWNAEGVPTGVYFYRLFTEGGVLTRKAMIIR